MGFMRQGLLADCGIQLHAEKRLPASGADLLGPCGIERPECGVHLDDAEKTGAYVALPSRRRDGRGRNRRAAKPCFGENRKLAKNTIPVENAIEPEMDVSSHSAR